MTKATNQQPQSKSGGVQQDKPGSMVGRYAALVCHQRQKGGECDAPYVRKVTDLVRISEETTSNVRVGNAYYSRLAGFHRRELGPNSRPRPNVWLSFELADIEAGEAIQRKRNEEAAQMDNKIKDRMIWLNEPGPAAANRIVGKLNILNNDDAVRRLTEAADVAILERIAAALEQPVPA